MKHINIPIFIPHLGCPNQCIFCNQRYISGNERFDFTKVEKEIEVVLSGLSKNYECEIAFFGGSFTGIDRDLMINLLELAQSYVNSGKVCGIRMSTRPDYISEEIIKVLKNYTITFVELGVQSLNDDVLTYLKRGHTVNDTENAIRLLNNASIPFVAQMMIGLPKATLDDEIYCAKRMCELGASGARIYPTLVFKETELEKITSYGGYTPLTSMEAIERCAEVLKIFNENSVSCIRIGLSDSENLHSDKTFVAGPNEPSIGEMVKSKLFYDEICSRLENFNHNNVTIECPKGKVSQVIGNKKENVLKLKEKFKLIDIKIIENSSLTNYEINIL